MTVSRSSSLKNPDVLVDTKAGEVYPKLPGGGIGDSIGNILDVIEHGH